ncbi:4-demethylwyosine synthase TYW1, partial [Candidatus Woesearchaeota archaeon]|nr:4-demethylwyosine synthase TYW1 [Candidatus Woesearchaeota archaeon]
HQPRHSDIMDFAKKIADKIGYEIVKEKLNSKVVLLKNPESKIGLNYWEN